MIDSNDTSIEGGTGFDTVSLENGMNLDFSDANLDTIINNIEKIDLTDNGAHVISNLSLDDVLDMTEPGKMLTIDGLGTEDEVQTVDKTGWTKDNSYTDTDASDGYNEYSYTNGTDSVTLKIDENIDNTGL